MDHDGYARGPRAADFAALVQRLEVWAADDGNVARFYNALVARVLPEDFSAKTLNVDVHGTEIMRQVFGNGRATILDQLEELLTGRGQHALPESDVVKLVTGELKGNINGTKHLMSDLGWIKQAVKWGGIDHKRQLWVQIGYTVQNGKIFGPDGFEQTLAMHLKEDWEVIR